MKGLTRVGPVWWAGLGLVVVVHLLANLILAPLRPTDAARLAQSLLWVATALVFVRLLPHRTPALRSSQRHILVQIAACAGLFQIVALLTAGFFNHFGKSPYPSTPTVLLRNGSYAAAMLVGLETGRAWLVGGRLSARRPLLFAGVTLVFALLRAYPLRIAQLNLSFGTVEYLEETLVPLLAESMLVSFLAAMGGIVPALVYRGALEAFWWFSPVLPDLPWSIAGLVGTLGPIISLLVVQAVVSRLSRPTPARERPHQTSLPGWLGVAVTCVLFIWFALGLFPLHPTLVVSGSMRPVADVGDIVIVHKTLAEGIQEGDLIQFRVDNISVLHRVLAIREAPGGRTFVTKGDANALPDPAPVSEKQVVGRAVLVIPRIGWLSISLRHLLGELTVT